MAQTRQEHATAGYPIDREAGSHVANGALPAVRLSQQHRLHPGDARHEADGYLGPLRLTG